MGPIWDAELRVWDAKNFGLVSPGTHRNKFVKKSLNIGAFAFKIVWGTLKRPLKGGSRLIEVTATAGLTVNF